MDATNFAYWLNGFAELHGDTPPTKAQWEAIREHLALVFKKVTPPVGAPGIPPQIGHPFGHPQRLPNINPSVSPWSPQAPNQKPWTIECGLLGDLAAQTFC